MNVDRGFLWAALSGAVVSLILFTAMVTGGTFDLTGVTPGNGPTSLSGFYDAQAESLIQGRWNVPPEVLGGENLVIDGRSYAYYGPVPAVIRMPFMFLAPDIVRGHMNTLSMIAACIVFLAGLACLLYEIHSREWSSGDARVAGLLLAFSCPATEVMFAASETFAYHESRMWALGFCPLTFAFFLALVRRPSARLLVLTAGSAAASILASVPIGLASSIPLMLYAGVLVLSRLRAYQLPSRFQVTMALASIVPLLLMIYVNQVKFHTWFNVPFQYHVAWTTNPARMAIYEENGGLFNASFIPTNLRQYVRLDSLTKTDLPPWYATKFGFWNHLAGPFETNGARYDGMFPHTSATNTMPALCLLASIGLFHAVKSRRIVLIPLVISGLIGTLPTLASADIGERFKLDFLPLLLPLGIVGAFKIIHWPPILRIVAVATVLCLAAWSVVINLALALEYQRVLMGWDPGMIESYKQFQQDLASLHVSTILLVALSLLIVSYFLGRVHGIDSARRSGNFSDEQVEATRSDPSSSESREDRGKPEASVAGLPT